MPVNAADVIIVGAGPAGSTAALLLARAGHDVLLLDRSEFPRPKPCGDCLSAGASTVLRDMGVLDRVLRLPHARLRGWQIVAPDGGSFAGTFAAAGTGAPADALAVERFHLDACLAAAAAEAGARFLGGARVEDLLRGPGGHVAGVRLRDAALRARLVIGADGLRSIVARRLGAVRRAPRLRKVSLSFHVDAPVARPDLGEMHTADGTCAGIAPLRSDASRCNVTLVADADRFGRAVAADPVAFALHAVASMPRLRGRIAPDMLRTADMLASGPFDRPVSPATYNGAALVGDAAGYYDPFTGQGVYQALAGAVMLATVADDALQRGDTSAHALARYEKQRRRLVRAPRTLQRVIEAVLARPRLANLAIARIGSARRFADAMIAVTGDIAPAHRLLAPRALLSLLHPAPRGST
jgi:menaquinone-9 beta-reductase